MVRHLILTIIIFLFAPFCFPQAVDEAQHTVIGFSVEGSAVQRELERRIAELVSPENCREIVKTLTSEPNLAGTPGDRRNAEFVRGFLESCGFETRIYEYHVYLPYVRKLEVRIAGDNPVTLRPGEHGTETDSDTLECGDYPPFIAYSPSAVVSGPVVYANYATHEDFEELASLGIDVRGAVLLARYGRTYRGSKAFEAESRGAAALILYPDPANDGYVVGDTYPDGPMRPSDASQRGSILYFFHSPGDPLTPGKPALENAERLDPEAAGLPAIPTVTLGYGKAAEILSRIKGCEVPKGWQGGLPLRYHVGPGPVSATVRIESEFALRPIWNVVGILRGREYPDQWVLVGGHRDAWVRGAMDPHSGGAVMLEAARAIAETSRDQGLRRSLVVCSWDAEEFGLQGSVEWVEHLREELSRKGVVYVNADSMVSGSSFGASATPTLRPMFAQVLRECTDPNGIPISQCWLERLSESGVSPTGNLPFGLFGGGSDHTGFLNHVGIPCAAFGFGGRQGIYHSCYDTLRWMETFGDPGFRYHASAAKLMATLLSRFANAQILPIAPAQYAGQLREFVSVLSEDDERLARLAETRLEPAIQEMESLSTLLESELQKLQMSDETERKKATVDFVNSKLLLLERSFVSDAGLPGRPWYRNVLYAPDLSNGYGLEIFPVLREAHKRNINVETEFTHIGTAIETYRELMAETLAKALSFNSK